MSELKDLAQLQKSQAVEREVKRHTEKVVNLDDRFERKFRTYGEDHTPHHNSVYNLELILKNHKELKGKLIFNEFTYEECLKEPITLNGNSLDAGRLEDTFNHVVTSFIEQTYDFTPSTNAIVGGVSIAARLNGYHPIKEYLQGVEKTWDGNKRIETLLSTYLGVEQSEYSHKSLLCFLIGAIQRIYNPEEKFDFVLDLVGDTGTGKTTLLQKLFLEDYYTDSMQTFDKPDDIILMMAAWCVNDDEMVVSGKTGIENLKKFATQKAFEYRVPYGRRPVKRARTFVISRTTNLTTHLIDKTGNRRFLPNRANQEQQQIHPANLTDSEVAQVWAEAMHEYKQIDRKKLFLEVEQLADEYRESFLTIDSIEEIVMDVLAVPVPFDFYEYNDNQRASYVQGWLSGERKTLGNKPYHEDDLVERDRIRIRDLSLEGFDEPLGRNNKRDNKIRMIIDNLPDWVKSKRNGLRFGKKTSTGYKRK
ncbi:MAG: VapE domain-containing protein [Enterococcus sp.]